MEPDPNVAEPAVVLIGYPIRRCLAESFEYQPLLMAGLVVALAVSVWLMGLRIREWWQGSATEARNPVRRSRAEVLEFALGRLVLAGIVTRTCLGMIDLAYAGSQGAALRLPFEGFTSVDVYLFAAPLLVACVVYANCTVASLIGKMRGRGS
ncbi:MAG: hypothetical protein J0L73_27945 [Verrucomicrobia bacterium]|nr:hypothetical protein [Verrucomicrobiota bacterium]